MATVHMIVPEICHQVRMATLLLIPSTTKLKNVMVDVGPLHHCPRLAMALTLHVAAQMFRHNTLHKKG